MTWRVTKVGKFFIILFAYYGNFCGVKIIESSKRTINWTLIPVNTAVSMCGIPIPIPIPHIFQIPIPIPEVGIFMVGISVFLKHVHFELNLIKSNFFLKYILQLAIEIISYNYNIIVICCEKYE